MRDKPLKNKLAEIIALCLFVILYIVITAFHEPWFDEAQAWQIAKCASLKELLFEIPHYEGHPPLWHLILAIPAKTGVPFEIGLKTVGFMFAAACVYLILFKMPFPRAMRLLLPFSFFIFYQYGVIVRPYGLMMLVLLAMSLAFPQKDAHPWRFIGQMVLLCMTCAYGIVLAGGIALAMVWDLIADKGLRRFFHELFTDPRTLALGLLLIVAILLILEISPRSNTLVTSRNATNPFIICLICALFTFLGECTLSTSSWFSADTILLQYARIPVLELILFSLIGLILWVLIIGVSSRRALKYFVIPYSLFAVFSAAIYGTVHHAGIALLLMLFWAGLLFQDANRYEIGRAVARKLSFTPRDQKLVRTAAVILCMACLAMPVYWCVSSMVLEIQKEYSYGRHGSAFIKEHQLDHSLILSDWSFSSLNEYEVRDKIGIVNNVYHVATPTVLNAYFDHNICLNQNFGRDNEAYMHYKIPTEAEKNEALSYWKSAGIPEIIIGRPPVQTLYDGVSLSDYTIVYLLKMNYIWKNAASSMVEPVYARNDIMGKYDLERTDAKGLQYKLDGLQVTDEMREQFEAGVPVEEILDPYLDAMFGETPQ